MESEVTVKSKVLLDRTERQRQLDEELKCYEEELTQRREQRRREREALRQKERKIDDVLTQLNGKTNESSIKAAQVQYVNDTLIQFQHDHQQRDLQRKRIADKEAFQLREKRLQEWKAMRRQKRIPPPPKQYVIQSAEFYGADFTPDTRIEKQQRELFDLSLQQETEFLNNPDRIDLFVQHGNALIQALTQSKNAEPEEIRTLVQKLRSSQPEELDPVQVAVDGLFPETSGPFGTLSVDSMSKRTLALGTKIPLAPPQQKPGNSTDSLLQNQSNPLKKMHYTQKASIDYSEFFPTALGAKSGVFVFIILDLKPVMLPAQKRNYFCYGECYIILECIEKTNGQMEYQLFIWQGNMASLDKKACSAIFAVALREHLHVPSEVIREEAGQESENLHKVFAGVGEDLHFVDAMKATPSGLFKVQPREYPLLVFRICNIKESAGEGAPSKASKFDVELVEPTLSSLYSNYVYLVDAGLKIYQWNGLKSSLLDRSRCRFLANRIKDNDRPVGKARFSEILEGEEPGDFWMNFNGEIRSDKITNENMENPAAPKLYVFTNQLTVQDIQSPDFTRFLTHPLEGVNARSPLRSMLPEDGCAVLDCVKEVYFWVSKASTLKQRSIAEQILIKHIYPFIQRPEYVCISKIHETAEPEIFKSRFSAWDKDLIKGVDYTYSKPGTLRIVPSRVQTGKKALSDPSVSSQIKVDVQALFKPPHSGKLSLDEERLLQSLFEKATVLLEAMQSYIFDQQKRKFVRIAQWNVDGGRETGHFWSGESYVFVCIYHRELLKTQDFNSTLPNRLTTKSLKQKNATDSESFLDDRKSRDSLLKLDATEKESDRECVIYFWSGRDARRPSFAYPFYEHHFRRQITEKLQGLGGTIPVKTVVLDQEKECLALLAHCGQSCIIHKGLRPTSLPELIDENEKPTSLLKDMELNTDQIHLYHLRMDAKYKVMRAVELPTMVTSLASRDCFVLTAVDNRQLFEPLVPSPENTMLWIGRGASKEEEWKARDLCKRLAEFYTKAETRSKSDPYALVKEGSEPTTFWRLLGPTFKVPELPNGLPKGAGYHFITPPPRFFRCSTESGNFVVTDLSLNYSVLDLQPAAICFIDSCPKAGRDYPIWIWVGAAVSDVTLKLSKKAVEAYLEKNNDGRNLDGSDWDVNLQSILENKITSKSQKKRTTLLRPCVQIVHQFKEPVDFKSFFLGWGDFYTFDQDAATRAKIVIGSMSTVAPSPKEEPISAFKREEASLRKLH